MTIALSTIYGMHVYNVIAVYFSVSHLSVCVAWGGGGGGVLTNSLIPYSWDYNYPYLELVYQCGVLISVWGSYISVGFFYQCWVLISVWCSYTSVGFLYQCGVLISVWGSYIMLGNCTIE